MWSACKRAAQLRLSTGLAVAVILIAVVAAPSIAQERLDQDLGIIRACGPEVWRLCSGVLPDVGRVKACVQNKMGQLSKGCLDLLLDKMAGSSFKVCKNQTYALCAAARCNVYDGVAYCPGQGRGRLLDERRREGSGAYAQCDGGLCFRSSEETTFPGFDKPVPKGQIICSCPITQYNGQGYQILGPYPCDKSFFRYCKGDTANSKTGSTIYVGAPIGTAQALAVLPPVNECGSK